MCLNSHYRRQLVFSFDALDQATNTLNKLKSRIADISDEGNLDKEKYDLYNNKFISEISNDLNISNTITIIYDLLKDSSVNGHTKLELINDFDKVLSLELTHKEDNDSELTEYIQSKIEERNEAKKNKDYNLADKIRNELLDKGIELMDTREGTKYKISKQ